MLGDSFFSVAHDCAMGTKTLPDISHPLTKRLLAAVEQARQAGVKPTKLASLAGLPPSTINRKLNGSDKTLIKPDTLLKIEAAVASLNGNHLGEVDAVSEINKINEDGWRLLEELVEILVSTNVLPKDQLSERMTRAIERRRYLLSLIDKAH